MHPKSLAFSSPVFALRDTDSPQIEATKPRKIASAVRKAGKRASGKPSLWVKLSLPAPTLREVPQLPLPWSPSAPEVKIENNCEAQAESSSRNLKKRSAALAANDDYDNDDESDLFTPSSSRDQAPKRQRLQPSAPKPRAAPNAKSAVKYEDDHRPEPRGQPEVWAEVPINIYRFWSTRLIWFLDASSALRVLTVLSSLSVWCIHLWWLRLRVSVGQRQ